MFCDRRDSSSEMHEYRHDGFRKNPKQKNTHVSQERERGEENRLIQKVDALRPLAYGGDQGGRRRWSCARDRGRRCWFGWGQGRLVDSQEWRREHNIKDETISGSKREFHSCWGILKLEFVRDGKKVKFEVLGCECQEAAGVGDFDDWRRKRCRARSSWCCFYAHESALGARRLA